MIAVESLSRKYSACILYFSPGARVTRTNFVAPRRVQRSFRRNVACLFVYFIFSWNRFFFRAVVTNDGCCARRRDARNRRTRFDEDSPMSL